MFECIFVGIFVSRSEVTLDTFCLREKNKTERENYRREREREIVSISIRKSCNKSLRILSTNTSNVVYIRKNRHNSLARNC